MFIVNQNIINFHLRCDCSFHFVIASFLGVLLGRTAHTKGRSAGSKQRWVSRTLAGLAVGL